MSKTQPTAEIRVGQIKATIWKNDTDAGTRFNVTVTQIYKEGEEWKYSETFGRNDLLVLAKLLDRAHDRIYELQMQLVELSSTFHTQTRWSMASGFSLRVPYFLLPKTK